MSKVDNTNKKKPMLPKIKLVDVMPKNPLDMKCGPTLEFENGSCYPLSLLVDMAEAYNKYNKENGKKEHIELHEEFEITEPENYKLFLLSEFKKHFSGDQRDWMNKKYTEFMGDKTKDYLQNQIFRPDGPQGKFEWL